MGIWEPHPGDYPGVQSCLSMESVRWLRCNLHPGFVPIGFSSFTCSKIFELTRSQRDLY
jgi:hypothetical protein